MLAVVDSGDWGLARDRDRETTPWWEEKNRGVF